MFDWLGNLVCVFNFIKNSFLFCTLFPFNLTTTILIIYFFFSIVVV